MFELLLFKVGFSMSSKTEAVYNFYYNWVGFAQCFGWAVYIDIIKIMPCTMQTKQVCTLICPCVFHDLIPML